MKDQIISGSNLLNSILENNRTDAMIFLFSFFHLILISMNTCHGAKGELDNLCAKAWINCKAAAGLSLFENNQNSTCSLRTCLLPGCQIVQKPFSDRPVFATLLMNANYAFRWFYSGLVILHMVAKGIFYKENAFIKDPWCILLALVVVAAWCETVYVFGNFMFWVALFGFKALAKSTHPYLAIARIQVKALGLGIYKVVVVFLILNFIMLFCGLLGLSLYGLKGDNYNRCAVPLVSNGGTSMATFTYEPIIPEVPCRMDQMYTVDVKHCYGDVWTATSTNFTPSRYISNFTERGGCSGSCGQFRFFDPSILGKEINLNVEGTSAKGFPIRGSQVYCIGPDYFPLDKTSFPPQVSPVLGGGPMKNYIPPNISNWRGFGNNDPRNFNDIGHAAISMYTVFYRNSWSGGTSQLTDVGGKGVLVGYILVMLATSYYLLNITVSITCAHYSESVEKERVDAAKRAAEKAPPKFDDGDDDAVENVDEEEQDLSGFQILARERVLQDFKQEDYPTCGRGCDCFILVEYCLGAIFSAVNSFFQARKSGVFFYIYKFTNAPCSRLISICGISIRLCCHSFLKAAVVITFPSERKKSNNEDEFEEDMLPKRGKRSILSHLSFISMIGLLLTQALQNAEVDKYKCACKTIDDLQNIEQYRKCTSYDKCSTVIDGVTARLYNETCLFGRCVPNSVYGYPCINPRSNYLILKTKVKLTQTAADQWANSRSFWCLFGESLHYALYGWAIIFLLELLVRYSAHQGLRRFFTYELYPDHGGAYTPHYKNIADTLCICATVAGIVLTEVNFSHFSVQVYEGGVSYYNPRSISDPASPGNPWTFKLLRLATIIRVGIRIFRVSEVPAVAVILRGFRGIEKVFLGIFFLLFMIFLSAVTAKELFDEGYVFLQGRFNLVYNFLDLSTSILPLMQIVVGTGWYEYAASGTDSLGAAGFIFFCVFYFVVNFQFLRIFIAIIVQNYELNEEEKREAQKFILEDKFEKAEHMKSRSEKERFTNYDKFSFNRHYFELLRGAQISLRQLASYQQQLAEGRLKGFDENNEMLLTQETFMDEIRDGEEGGEEELDEVEQIKRQIKVVNLRLSINPQDKKRDDNRFDGDDDNVSIIEKVRSAVRALVKSDIFNYVITVVVIASVVFAVYTNLDQATGVSGLSNLLSVIFLGIFVLEMLLKMLAFGFFGKAPLGYFYRKWCLLDFVIVVLQALDVLVTLEPSVINLGSNSKILQGFRSLRILRLLARLQYIGGPNNPLRMVLQGLGASMPAIAVLVCAVVILTFVFALVGMDQYMGLLYRCVTEDSIDLTGTKCTTDSECFPGFVGQCAYNSTAGGLFSYCTMNKRACFGTRENIPSAYTSAHFKSVGSSDFTILIPRIWWNAPLNFDSIYSAMFTIYSMINRSYFQEMLVALLSVTERDMAQIKNYNASAAVYVIVLSLIVGVFVSQIAIGLLLTNMRLKSGLAFHLKEQLVWPATRDAFEFMPNPFKNARREEEEKEAHPLFLLVKAVRAKFTAIRDSYRYRLLMMATIIFNIAILSSMRYGADANLEILVFWGGFACFVLYCLEFVINVFADMKGYLMQFSGLFDTFLTLLNALELFVFPKLGVEVGLSSLRMFRLIRIFQLSPTFVKLMQTISISFPQAIATVALTFIMIFIFAAIATNMFSVLKEGAQLDPIQNNFADFPSALVALFRVSSGDSWGAVLQEAAISAPYCTPLPWTPLDVNASAPLIGTGQSAELQTFGTWKNKDMWGILQTDCGLEMGSYALFIIFVFINNYLILNTFIASIIASYFQANLRDYSLLTYEELEVFCECWNEAGSTMELSGVTPVSVMVFPRTTNPKEKIWKLDPAKGPEGINFDRFDTLLELLSMRNNKLGFNRMADVEKYKMAINRLKQRQKKGSGVMISYKSMAVMLLSIYEKARPVTIVDILRREKAIEVIAQQSDVAPRRRKQVGGLWHASSNLPPADSAAKLKKEGLEAPDIVYSYNIYVVLDQLSRLKDQDIRIPQETLAGLRELVENNDEDLFIYFEEYVEKSGPAFIDSGDAWRSLVRFGRKAVEIYALSNKFKSTRSKVRKKGNDEEMAEEAEGEEEEAQETASQGHRRGDGDASSQGPSEHLVPAGGFGDIIEDGDTTLDLRNWTECKNCGEPVDKAWEKCPSCFIAKPSTPTT